ncbi:MAG: response regulator [Pseudomonadota bacterium]
MKKKILVVDNDRLILEFMNDLLSGEGYDVVTAEDGVSALNMLKTYIPDIMFVDLVMPNIDGSKLTKTVRGMEALKNTHIIILSAIAAEREINIEELGANAIIAKGPFSEIGRNVLSVLKKLDLPSFKDLKKEVIGLNSLYPRGITDELLSAIRHFEIILERMSEGILEITREGIIIYANPMAISLFGISEENLIGSPLLQFFPKNDRGRIEALLGIEGDEPRRIDDHSPVSLNKFVLSMTILPVGGSTAVVILNDVTERKRAEESLKNRNIELGLLYQANQAFNSSLNLNQVLDAVLEEVRSRMDVVGSTVWLADPSTGDLFCRHATGPHEDHIIGWGLEPGEGIAG